MSITSSSLQSLKVLNPTNLGQILFDSQANITSIGQKNYLGSYQLTTIESYNGTFIHTISSNTDITNDIGYLNINAYGDTADSLQITALNSFTNNGGILINTGNGGITANTINGDISLNSNGANVMIGGPDTQNVIIHAVDNTDINTGNFNLVSQDTINIVSVTGNINLGSADNPVISFEHGNLLVNQKHSIYDRQVDINISHES